MRFLRMLTNCAMAGALGAAYLTVLVLQLNPQIPIVSSSTARWYLTLGTLYGVHLAVAFYVVMVLREFFALDMFSPGWVSVRMLAWMGAVAAAVAATLMWLNVRGFVAALTADAARRMTTGAIATTASAVVLLAIAVAHYSFGRRGGRVGASLFVMAAFGSLALPLAARGRAVPPPAAIVAAAASGAGEPMDAVPGPRVFMLLLDGASLDYILPRVAEGRLPAFAHLLDKGAVMDLATTRPTQPDSVWAAVATGMYPSKNGVRSAGSYVARGDTRAVDLLPDYCFSHALVRLGFVQNQPKVSAMWSARPLWSIVSSAGLSVGIVRWPLTYPAEPVKGFIVSDRFHVLSGSLAQFDHSAFPPEIVPALQMVFADPEADAPDGPAPPGLPGAGTPESSAMRRDRLYSAALWNLSRGADTRFTALRIDGLDIAGHYDLSATEPRTLHDGADDDRRRRQLQMIDAYYAFVDSELDAATSRLTSDDLLVVVSGFGMQPLDEVKRAIARLLGDPDFSGTHERAPDGFLLASGASVEPGRRPRGSVVDVAPTILYFLGLPVARDMDGFARADLFTRAFTAERPIVFIPTYTR
jgi:type I phosphodiesterase/nucleotide pyrophosphatase